MKTLLIAAALTIGVASGASATTFGGTFSGTFTGNGGFGSNSCTYGSGTGLAWGAPGPCPDFSVDFVDDELDSTMEIVNAPWGKTVSGIDSVLIGEIVWFNNANTAAEDFSTGMNLAFSVTDPVGGGPFNEFMNLDIENTPGNPPDNAFLLSFDDFGIAGPLTFGDVTMTGFSLSVTGAGSLSIDDDVDLLGPIGCFFSPQSCNLTELTWVNTEGGTSTLQIFANVEAPEANVIPLPAAGWMLLAGLGGLAAMKRRKKATAA